MAGDYKIRLDRRRRSSSSSLIKYFEIWNALKAWKRCVCWPCNSWYKFWQISHEHQDSSGKEHDAVSRAFALIVITASLPKSLASMSRGTPGWCLWLERMNQMEPSTVNALALPACRAITKLKKNIIHRIVFQYRHSLRQIHMVFVLMADPVLFRLCGASGSCRFFGLVFHLAWDGGRFCGRTFEWSVTMGLWSCCFPDWNHEFKFESGAPLFSPNICGPSLHTKFFGNSLGTAL